MRIGIPRETAPGESRVAIIPETAARFGKRGLEVVFEAGAGEPSRFPDGEYCGAGVTPTPSAFDADLVFKVQKPTLEEVGKLREGATLISLLYPLADRALVQALADRKASAIAVDMIPRTTLAQSMDALSSQANLAGYKAVVMAADRLPKFFPMMMTAAGTITPAKVLILGAGVAGLQAIATAKRLGAVVEAFDVRRVVKEQVESLGGRFVEVPGLTDAASGGGYARELTDEEKARQRDVIHAHVAKADVVITTALVPGKRAPILVTEPMVKDMRPGSVIVDLAAEQGGNCELTEPGQEAVRHGVTIVGHPNLPNMMPAHASQLYSRNMEKLLLHLLGPDNAMKWDFGDEITKGCVIVHQGRIVHPRLQGGA